MDFPTPIATSISTYNSHKDGLSGQQKYKALEATFQALIKFIVITFLLIAKDRDSEVYAKAALKVISSSSLGGWVEAMRFILNEIKFNDKNPVQDYLQFFSQRKNHPEKQILLKCKEKIKKIVDVLIGQGYRLESFERPNILEVFLTIVEIRNKCAHGNIPVVPYEKMAQEYEELLKEIVYILPLDKFTLYGRLNNLKYCLKGITPKLENRISEAMFRVESELLKDGYANDIPFMQFHYDTQKVFFLNDKVNEKSPGSEFINYAEGTIQYWNVDTSSIKLGRILDEKEQKLSEISDNDYKIIADFVPKLRPLPLDKSSINLLPEDSNMIYTFSIEPKLNGTKSFDLLYVGQSTNPLSRFRNYLQIYNGYNEDREEISLMFKKYKNKIVFKYLLLESSKNISKIELAFYNVFNPPFNLIAPPNS